MKLDLKDACIRMDKQQGPTVYHRKHIQYPVINHNRKGYLKEYMYN